MKRLALELRLGRAGALRCAHAACVDCCGCWQAWQAGGRASRLFTQGYREKVVDHNVVRRVAVQVQVGPKWAGGSCLGAAM